MELKRIVIITEVSELSLMLAMPREGYLDAVFHLFNYLEKQHNATSLTWHHLERNVIIRHSTIMCAPNVLTPRSKDVGLCMFVNSDHAPGHKQTWRSRTSFIIFLNMTPIVWFFCHCDQHSRRWVCRNETRHGMPAWTTLLVTDDGSGCFRPLIYLWGQHVRNPQHRTTHQPNPF